MEIRSLDGVGWEPLAIAFNEAFADYAVPVTITAEGLAAMQRRRGYVPELSFGAFDGERVVAFVFTCLEDGRAYNSGTGTVPSHRGSGLGQRVLEAVISRVRTYILEVIETNAPALALYRKLGFVETRRLGCWKYEGAGENLPAIDTDLEAIAREADMKLSWQNSVSSIRRAGDYVTIGDARGAVVLFPSSGDVPLLCVRRDARRQGHGKRLLAAAAARAGAPLRILNIDESVTGIVAFLEAAGAVRLPRQLEMVRAR